MTRILSIGLTALLLATPAFADKNADKRAKILKMRDDVLQRLYKEEPDTKKEIAGAEGYAVFSNVGVNVIFFSAGGGGALAAAGLATPTPGLAVLGGTGILMVDAALPLSSSVLAAPAGGTVLQD